MIRKSNIAIAAAILLAAVSTGLAKDNSVPKLDIEGACHASEKAVSAIFTITTDIYSSCLTDEQEALAQLEKDWATFPASDRGRCIQPKEYLPGYVEWLTCLEMVRDVKAMRKGQPTTETTPDKCPVVRYLDDGTILSVNAC